MDQPTETATLLLKAWRDPAQKLSSLPPALVPKDAAAAYAIQQQVIAGLGAIGGWKVGAPGPEAPPACAPLAAAGITTSPARLPAARYVLRGIEAEIAFRMGADLLPRDIPYTRTEIIAAIAECVPAIEVLESRFANPDSVDPLSNLADSNVHGGLVFGAPIPQWQTINFARESVRVAIDGATIKTATANPAGDMIRLIQWLADTGTRWAGGLRAGQIVTCGSWTGKDYAGPSTHVEIAFDHGTPVAVDFTP